MSFLGPLLAAGASGISAFSGLGAQRDANAINWQNLFETKRRNRETEKMAKSSRMDAYGNKLEYIPGVGWQIVNTPMTAAILGSQQNEELRNLREDAPRKRAQAERLDVRSRMGDEEFQRRFNEFRFRKKPDENQEIADATQDILGARRKGLDEASALLARQLMRTGGSSELASIYKQANDAYASSLEEAILKGKDVGKERYDKRSRSQLADLTGELDFLQKIADDTGDTTIGSPGNAINEALSGRSDKALSDLIAAMQSGTSSNQRASDVLSRGVADTSLDLSGVANALSRLGGGSGSYSSRSRATQQDPTYPSSNDPWAGLREVGANRFFG